MDRNEIEELIAWHEGEATVLVCREMPNVNLFKHLRSASALRHLLQVQTDLLTTLKDARDDIESWGAYATDYFQDKWDLEGCIKRYDEVLAKHATPSDQQNEGEA
jgi:hypothetical protein